MNRADLFSANTEAPYFARDATVSSNEIVFVLIVVVGLSYARIARIKSNCASRFAK